MQRERKREILKTESSGCKEDIPCVVATITSISGAIFVIDSFGIQCSHLNKVHGTIHISKIVSKERDQKNTLKLKRT